MSDSYESTGERLRALRQARGLTQRELAVPGVSYAYISRIEAGTRNASVRALRKLAAKLDVSAEWLETGAEPDRWAAFASDERRAIRAALEAAVATAVGKRLVAELADAERRLPEG